MRRCWSSPITASAAPAPPALRLNRWLAAAGVARASRRAPRRARWAGRLRAAAVRAVPERWQAPCFRARRRRAGEPRRERRALRRHRLARHARVLGGAQLLSRRSGSTCTGAIDCGTVPVARLPARCATSSRAALLAWRDPVNGERGGARRSGSATRSISGPCVAMAPDLVLDLATPGGYSYVGLPSYGEDGPAIEALDPAALGGGKLRGHERQSSRRRPVHAAPATAVRPGRVDGAQIADMAPTILALCGVAGAGRLGWPRRSPALAPRPRLTPSGAGGLVAGGVALRRGRRGRPAAAARAAGISRMSPARRYRIAVVAACPFPSLRGSQVLVRETRRGPRARRARGARRHLSDRAAPGAGRAHRDPPRARSCPGCGRRVRSAGRRSCSTCCSPGCCCRSCGASASTSSTRTTSKRRWSRTWCAG